MLNTVLNQIRNNPGLLPLPYRTLAEKVNVDAAIFTAQSIGGKFKHFPTLEKASIKARNLCIKKEFNGGNNKELAEKYGLSPIGIKRIAANKQ